jgi:hypothetical protein
VLLATGIRASELAGIRYLPDDPYRSDVDLAAREVRVRANDGSPRTVRLTHERGGGWTGTCAPGPGISRRGGRSCG